jgi:hypothetical protein
VIAFGAGRYAFVSALHYGEASYNAGKPSLAPLH